MGAVRRHHQRRDGPLRRRYPCDALRCCPNKRPGRTNRDYAAEIMSSQVHYLPMTPGLFSILVVLLAGLIILIQLRILRYAYMRLGVGPGVALLLLFGSLIGSYFNIPITILPGPPVRSGQIIEFFGMRYVVPVVVAWPGTVLAVNVGGAVIPTLMSTYLVIRYQLWLKATLATTAIAFIIHAMASPRLSVATATGLVTRIAGKVLLCGRQFKRPSVANHPRPRRRKTFRAAPCLLHQPRRLGRAASAARPVRGFVFADGLGRVGAALVGGVGLALVGGHAEEIRGRQDGARRFTLASWAILRRVTFRHRPHIRERTAIVAEIFVNRHFTSSRAFNSQHAGNAGRQIRTAPHPRRETICLATTASGCRP
jgi:hypothetical protein